MENAELINRTFENYGVFLEYADGYKCYNFMIRRSEDNFSSNVASLFSVQILDPKEVRALQKNPLTVLEAVTWRLNSLEKTHSNFITARVNFYGSTASLRLDTAFHSILINPISAFDIYSYAFGDSQVPTEWKDTMISSMHLKVNHNFFEKFYSHIFYSFINLARGYIGLPFDTTTYFYKG